MPYGTPRNDGVGGDCFGRTLSFLGMTGRRGAYVLLRNDKKKAALLAMTGKEGATPNDKKRMFLTRTNTSYNHYQIQIYNYTHLATMSSYLNLIFMV